MAQITVDFGDAVSTLSLDQDNLFYWATGNQKSTTIDLSGYNKVNIMIIKDSRDKTVNTFPVVAFNEYTVEELSTDKTIEIPKSVTGWSSDYSATINSTTLSATTDGIGFLIIKYK